MTGFVEGKSSVRQRETYLTTIKERTPVELIHMVRERCLVGNVEVAAYVNMMNGQTISLRQHDEWSNHHGNIDIDRNNICT